MSIVYLSAGHGGERLLEGKRVHRMCKGIGVLLTRLNRTISTQNYETRVHNHNVPNGFIPFFHRTTLHHGRPAGDVWKRDLGGHHMVWCVTTRGSSDSIGAYLALCV